MDYLSDNEFSKDKLIQKSLCGNRKDSLLLKGTDKATIQKLNDENLDTLKKIHAILLNCMNLSKNQKLEFTESERYFMKLYLKKLKDKIDHFK